MDLLSFVSLATLLFVAKVATQTQAFFIMIGLTILNVVVLGHFIYEKFNV